MREFLNLDVFPIDQPDSADYQQLVARCQAELVEHGMFNLVDFLKPDSAGTAASEVGPMMATQSFAHTRAHNIYFRKNIPGLAPDHPALQLRETINHTICADQMADGIVMKTYEYQPLVDFLRDVMGKEQLHLMSDPLARANVMAYREGEALNWHFDRSEFTTTLLLQAPDTGGEFQYRSDLRSDEDPNYAGVANLLNGNDPEVKSLSLTPGTLNVFRGKNTAHRVTPVVGNRERVVAVFSYYEQPGVMFTEQERIGFYGRAA